MKKAVALYRVSTGKQGKSGLGLEAQKETVTKYVELAGLVLEQEYQEVISGRDKKRPVLKKAIRYCKKHECVLVIAKLDRLARNVKLIVELLENKISFVVAEKPFADRWEILRQAITDEEECFKISERTKKALQAAKRRGVELGKNGKKLAAENKQKADIFARAMYPTIAQLESDGFESLRRIASELNRQKVPTYCGHGARWHKSTVSNLLHRI